MAGEHIDLEPVQNKNPIVPFVPRAEVVSRRKHGPRDPSLGAVRGLNSEFAELGYTILLPGTDPASENDCERRG